MSDTTTRSVRQPDPFVMEFMDREMVEMLRSKTTTEKIAMVGAAHRTVKLLMACGIRGTHPDWSDEKIQAEVTRKIFSGTT